MNKLFLLRQSCREDNYFTPPNPPVDCKGRDKKLCTPTPLNGWFAHCCDFSVPYPHPSPKKRVGQQNNNGRMFSGSPRSSPLDGQCESLDLNRSCCFFLLHSDYVSVRVFNRAEDELAPLAQLTSPAA